MRKILLALIFWACLPCPFVFAAKVASLYQVLLPVSTQSDSERAQVIKQGLAQVLIKVTGDPQVVNQPDIKDVLKRADYYVQEYTYSSPSTASSIYQIQIRYSKDDVNRLLKRSGVSYWNENRPLILAWVAVSNKQHPAEIIGDASRSNTLDDMRQQGKAYGLPLIFPMMDATELDEVSPDDVTTMNLLTLQTAAKRYQSDALLIGKIEQNKNGFQSQWQLVLDSNQWKWSIADKTTDKIIAAVIQQVSQTLSKHYVAKLNNVKQMWLKIEVINIEQPDQLNELVHYLKQLTPVLDVQLSQVAGEDVELSILVRGNMITFLKSASLGQHLVLKTQDEISNRLIYEWVN